VCERGEKERGEKERGEKERERERERDFYTFYLFVVVLSVERRQ